MRRVPDELAQPATSPSAIRVTARAMDRVTDVDIRIDRVGAGRPIVVLNGLLGLNEHWFSCLGELSRAGEVLLLQPPLLEMKGRGLTVEGVTDLVAGVLESLLEQPAVVVGNSLGGHIGLRLALERPRLLRGLVLVGSSGLFERTFERDVEHSPSREWMQRKIASLFHDPARMLPGMVDRAHAELSKRSAARALVKLGRSAKRDHLGDRLHRVRTPTLLVWGRQDIVTPPEVAEQFREGIAGARLEWIDRCGHAPQIEQPDALARHIAAFVRTLEADERSGVEAGAA